MWGPAEEPASLWVDDRAPQVYTKLLWGRALPSLGKTISAVSVTIASSDFKSIPKP